MSYRKKIEYEIALEGSFEVIRNCPKCGRKTHYINTKNFRVNVNGNRLDVWLIYQCKECKHTLNLAVYERQKVSSIPKEEYTRFLDNDRPLAETYGKNLRFFLKNKAEIDMGRINYGYVRLHETTEDSGTGAQILITIHNPRGLKIRPEKQIAEVAGLSRSQVKSLLEGGGMEIIGNHPKTVSVLIHESNLRRLCP